MNNVPPKRCPLCREHLIEDWESACWWCWQKIIWHDREFGTNWCKNLIVLNHLREECKKCGFDPIEGMPR